MYNSTCALRFPEDQLCKVENNYSWLKRGCNLNSIDVLTVYLHYCFFYLVSQLKLTCQFFSVSFFCIQGLHEEGFASHSLRKLIILGRSFIYRFKTLRNKHFIQISKIECKNNSPPVFIESKWSPILQN